MIAFPPHKKRIKQSQYQADRQARTADVFKQDQAAARTARPFGLGYRLALIGNCPERQRENDGFRCFVGKVECLSIAKPKHAAVLSPASPY
jgi:hypothetical protein